MKKFVTFFLVFVVGFCAPLPSFAGYAQLKPPPGWSQGIGSVVPGQAGTFNFGKAANGASWKGSTVLTNAALNVGGQAIVVPASMRLAANAATVAAEWSFGNPYFFAIAFAAPLAYQWFQDKGLMVKDGAWGKTDPSACASNCFEYLIHPATTWSKTAMGAAAVYASLNNYSGPTDSITFIPTSCSTTKCTLKVNQYVDGQLYSSTNRTVDLLKRSAPPHDPPLLPVGRTEFMETIAPSPMPAGVPKELPDVDWPVLPPAFNPDPATIPNTSPSPQPLDRPMWVPTGDPVKQPNPLIEPTPANPNPVQRPDVWTQPGVRVQPAPSPDKPWQVEVTPAPRDSPNPTPVRDPITGTPLDPIPDPNNDGQPNPNPAPAPTPLDIITCGLPATPPCKIDEAGTPSDGEKPFKQPKTELDTTKDAVKTEIEKAAKIQAPTWTFTFQFPTGCAPYATGLRGVILNICQYQSTIHDLMSMIWAATTAFVLVGMVGRTIRES